MAGKKRQRTRAVVQEAATKTMSFDELKSLMASTPNAKGTISEESTVKGYMSQIKRVANDLEYSLDNVIPWIEDFSSIHEYAQEKERTGQFSTNTMKTFYSAFNLASKIADVSEDVQKFYQTNMFEFIKKSRKKAEKNYIPEKFGAKLPSWAELVDLSSKFVDKDEKYNINHVTVALYTLTYPRRLEYYSTIYLDKKPTHRPTRRPKGDNDDFDAKGTPYNYIYPTGTGDNLRYHFVSGNYKTKDKHFIYENTFGKELSSIVKGYIDKRKIKSGEYLLLNALRNKFKTSGDRSKALKVSFGKHYKKYEVTENDIRHIWETSMQQNEFKVPVNGTEKYFKDLTTGDKEEFAYHLGHSVATAENYRQIVPHPNWVRKQKALTKAREEAGEPEPEVQQEAQPEPQNDPNDGLVDEPIDDVGIDVGTTTKADVLFTMKKYYELKIKFIEKQLSMLG
jgi:hypothetical protein